MPSSCTTCGQISSSPRRCARCARCPTTTSMRSHRRSKRARACSPWTPTPWARCSVTPARWPTPQTDGTLRSSLCAMRLPESTAFDSRCAGPPGRSADGRALSPRRVLYVHSSSGRYGADRQLLLVASGLDRARYEPIVALPDKGPLASDLMDEGVEVVARPLSVLRRQNLNPLGLTSTVAAAGRD